MNGLLQTLRGLGPVRLAAMGGVTLLMIGFFIYLMSRLSAPDMALLYSDLDVRDSGSVAQLLEEAQIPYRSDAGGTTLMVPSSEVDRARLLAAEQGLPNGGSIGYELFDQSDGFGTTNFMQNLNRVRALEGELARTIGTINGVRQARVHLVLPERQLFSREADEPRASVFLRLDRASLGGEQVQSIQFLVAAAVSRLDPQNISIVDDRGNLLARGVGSDDTAYLMENNDELQRQTEARLTRTVEDLLAGILGFGKVRAQVSVDMDFDRVNLTEERFDPEGSVLRSSQFITEESQSNEAGGVDPVTVASNLPEQDGEASGGGLGGASASDSSERTEEVNNFEVSRVVQNTVRDSGIVRRLSVAVLVDGTYRTDPETGETEYVARTPEELAELEALVRAAVGFDDTRGDVIEVSNLPFVQGDETLFEDQALFLGMSKDDLFRLAEMLVLGIVAVLVILLVVRPLLMRVLDGGDGQAASDEEDEFALLTDQGALQRALSGPGPAQLTGPGGQMMLEGGDDEEIDNMINLSQVEGRVRASSIKKIGEIVDKHPEEAVSIIRTWMYQET